MQDTCESLMASYERLILNNVSSKVMSGGAILFVFCLFMLSVTQSQQYYQVSRSEHTLGNLLIYNAYLGLPSAGSRTWTCGRFNLCSGARSYLSLVPST
jgi:hypothetical protein